jgi:uncharacterized membrane protein YbhN (UPF0104 family)
MTSRAFTILKVLLAGALLAYLVAAIGPAQIGRVLHALDARYFAVLYALLVVDLVLRVFNWRALLERKTGRLPLGGMVRAYLVGGFLGSVIPSSLGTDVSRSIVAAQRHGVRVQDATLAIMVLNLVGLLATCIMALIGSTLLLAAGGDSSIIWAIVPVCVAFLAVFPLLLRGWMPDARRPGRPRLERFLARIGAFSAALRAFSSSPRTLASVLGIAMLNQLLGILVVFTVAQAFDPGVPLFYFLAFVPIMTLSRLIPLSVAGLGAEQGVFVVVFAQAGIPAAQAFLMSLILSVVNLTFVLAGGAVYGAENVRRVLRGGTQS